QPGEKYFQALRKRFEAVSHRVGALQRLERRLLVEGEPTLREQFLSALKAHAGGDVTKLKMLEAVPESELALLEEKLETETEAVTGATKSAE
ncbi:unnamed protein product, partial [Effrenium voratum]